MLAKLWPWVLAGAVCGLHGSWPRAQEGAANPVEEESRWRGTFCSLLLGNNVETVWAIDLPPAESVLPEDWTGPAVELEFTAEAAERFAALTGDNVDRGLAILVNARVMSAPVIKERIAGGKARITLGGGNSPAARAEAQQLARTLGAGALEAPLTLLGTRNLTRPGPWGRLGAFLICWPQLLLEGW
jgi:hypothetical protein